MRQSPSYLTSTMFAKKNFSPSCAAKAVTNLKINEQVQGTSTVVAIVSESN